MAFTAFVRCCSGFSVDDTFDNGESSYDDLDEEVDLKATYNNTFKECTKLNNLTFKKLNEVEHEKWTLIVKLFDSHALVVSLKNENCVLNRKSSHLKMI
jgi:hypothetical protein